MMISEQPDLDESFHLDEYLDQFPSQIYKRKTVLMQPNQNLEHVFFIKQGYMKIYKISEEGEELTLAILKPKDFFPVSLGLNSLQSDYFLESLTALEMVKVPKNAFVSYLKQNPALFFELTNRILSRFGGLLARMEYLMMSNAYNKIAVLVLMCAKRFGEVASDGLIIKVPLTQKDIGTLAGVTRETTCVEMKKLEKKGLVAYKGRMLVVKDLDALEEEALFDKRQDTLLQNSL